MKKLFFIAFTFLTISVTFSQNKKDKKYNIRTVAFYNLENLFDTVNDTLKNDEASPIMEMVKENRDKVYQDKLIKLSTVIEQLGKDKSRTSPAILGVAEIENRKVLEDLTKTDLLKSKRYDIIHFDSPDKRGIDVALLYQPRYFKPIHYEAFNPNLYRDNRKVYTRDILWVSGYLDDELVHIIVNHWPSKRGGTRSIPLREKAAYKVTQIIEKIKETEENPKVIIMGDFNDDPVETSFKKVLKTKRKKKNVTDGDIYNPFEDMFSRGFNTGAYRDNISLFDQVLITSPLLDKGKKDFSTFKMYKAGIFNKRYMTNKKGRFKGYPKRSFSYGTYTGGYSDHFPVYMHLIKEKK